ncbi:DUF3618 domain-containing protein [Streptomyces sp. MST-110588]|uniref:DUF3618 domain-containing protein n=1 Tax=Streptomyces sp. MST-110588 TaxID=2833628 RepID=UPI001F5CFFCC|nr:DUF3618 domain-containing protein [Streptomyces sp. MST-110588]UNO39870.1 DUF3618 domain-containing protein [Streptomyces sp. MST-110588]
MTSESRTDEKKTSAAAREPAAAQEPTPTPTPEPESAKREEAAPSPEELRERIERTRRELGDTVAELAARADVKSRARQEAVRLRDRTYGRARAVTTRALGASRRHPARTAGAAGGVLLVGAGVLVLRSRDSGHGTASGRTASRAIRAGGRTVRADRALRAVRALRTVRALRAARVGRLARVGRGRRTARGLGRCR